MSAGRSRRLLKVTMSAFSALDTLLDQYDGKNTDLLVRISEDWLPSQIHLPAVSSATNLRQRRARTRRGPRSSGAGGPNENCCR